MTRGLFITATGTSCGKTWLARGLARALVLQGKTVAGLKPVETGVLDEPLDAEALARAAGRPELARAPGLVRLRAPLAPYPAALAESCTLPSPEVLAARLHELGRGLDCVLAEGAGGLLVPFTRDTSLADVASATGWPLLLVGRDALGTLSHVLTALESAERRGLHVRAVVLCRGPWSDRDASTDTNASVLAERTTVPVRLFPACTDDDDALAVAASPLLPVLFP